jgi:excisionase family DNA binding protein
MDETSRLLTVKETCTYLRISAPTLYRMLERQELVPVKIGKRTLFDKKDLDVYIDTSKGPKAGKLRRQVRKKQQIKPETSLGPEPKTTPETKPVPEPETKPEAKSKIRREPKPETKPKEKPKPKPEPDRLF